MKATAFIANIFFILLNYRKYRSFLSACKNPEDVQKKILLSIVRKNRDSKFGKLHSFRSIKSIQNYQEEIPITSYEGHYSYISRIMHGEQNVLCSERVKYLALTSGSSAASKFIPYTATLKREFRHSINPWIYDLLLNFRRLKYGTQFWIITPASSKTDLPGCSVPIGFENDSDYFGRIEKYLIRTVLSLPDEINKISDTSNYFYMIGYLLLKDEELRLISVWNPSLLITILKFIKDNFVQLSNDIATREIHLPNEESPGDRELAEIFRSRHSRRGKFLTNLKEFKPSSIKTIWPRLELISCWTDAWARVFIEEMRK